MNSFTCQKGAFALGIHWAHSYLGNIQLRLSFLVAKKNWLICWVVEVCRGLLVCLLQVLGGPPSTEFLDPRSAAGGGAAAFLAVHLASAMVCISVVCMPVELAYPCGLR